MVKVLNEISTLFNLQDISKNKSRSNIYRNEKLPVSEYKS